MRVYTMRNRIMSVILAACMILSMTPAAVSADEDTTPPLFGTGYPKQEGKEAEGSKRLVLTTGPLSEKSYIYFVVVAKGSGKPSAEQIKKGQDSIGKTALHSDKTVEYMTTNIIYNFSFPSEDNTEYDAYFLLEDAAGNQTLSDVLTVKTPEERLDPICEVAGGSKYNKIEDAISYVLASGGGTIKLLDHVYHYKPVKLNVTGNVIFDLNGKYFNIDAGHLDAPSGLAALEVSNGCRVSYINGGDDSKFDITGYEYGIKVIGSGSSATVNNVRSIGGSSIAAAAGDGCLITVNGNVGSKGTGVSSYGSVVVNGDIEVTGNGSEGLYSGYGGLVIVTGKVNATGENSTGLFVGNSSSASVTGDVTVTGEKSIGVYVHSSGSAAITGDIKATGRESNGVYARNNGSATINGNIDAEGTRAVGAYAEVEDASIDINGSISVSGDNSTGALVEDGGEIDVSSTDAAILMKGESAFGINVNYGGTVTVKGDIEASGDDAVGANVRGGSATVKGDIKMTGDRTVGADAADNGLIEIEGSVDATGEGVKGIYANFGEGSGGTVYVTENINVSSSDGSSTGIECYSWETKDGKSKVTVDGQVFADGIYIKIDGDSRTRDSEDTIEGGYWVYNGEHGSIVKIGNSEVVVPVYAPTVATNPVSNITTFSAILSGNVTNDGGAEVTERGFIYGTDSSLTTYTAIKSGAGTGGFTADITGLEENKTYYVCAYAKNSQGIGNGTIISFVTSKTPVDPPTDPPSSGGSSRTLTAPTVITKDVSGITEFEAMLSGSVTFDGGSAVTERGFVYGKKTNPALEVQGAVKALSGKGTGSFTALAENLEAGTTYHVRAYAVNKQGTSYGKDISFTTKEISVPAAGETGWLDASGIDLSNPYGNVVLYTDEDGVQHILGLGIIIGDRMKYVSRGQGKYEIIYNAKLFDDIAGHWAENDIDFASARLLFNGVRPGTFSPDTHMTRGMFAAVLGRMYGVKTELYSGPSFDDVSVSAYYAPYVKWAAENEVILGVSGNLFEPERAVTRQEMAAMMSRFMKFLGLKLTADNNEFSDDGLIDSWAKESIVLMKGTGIISGKPGNNFDPEGTSTRAEVAAVLRRLIEYIVK